MNSIATHKGQQCAILDIDGVDESDIWKPITLKINDVEYMARLISDKSMMIEMNVHDSISEAKALEIFQKVANPDGEESIKAELKRTKTVGTDQPATRVIVWINQGKIPKSWIKRGCAGTGTDWRAQQ